MKNIHILTTSKPSRLLNCIEGFRLFEEEVSPDNEWCVNVNIHMTSDEEIKEGDPRINNYQRKLKGEEIPSKKIILTTDIDLIKDGVQAIDDEFLEWFVKNPNCEEVEVEKWFDTSHIDLGYGSKVYHNNPNIPLYKIIIPTSGIDFGKELSKWGYNKGNSIDVEILVNEILPDLFKQFNK
jgi:hypothetical protein